MNKEIWDHHDNLVRNTPSRGHEWGIKSVGQEANEWMETDPSQDPEGFLHEGADVILSYMSAMKSAGFSYEVAIQAVMEKLNIVIDRTVIAEKMPHPTWEERYQAAKQQQQEIIVWET